MCMQTTCRYRAITRFEIIAKRGIIARLSKLYEKVRKDRFLNIFFTFWPLHKRSHTTASCTYERSQNKIIFIKTSAKSDPPLR